MSRSRTTSGTTFTADDEADDEDYDEDDPRAPLQRPSRQQPRRSTRNSYLLGASFVEPRRSVVLPTLVDEEKDFFALVEESNVTDVENFLNDRPNFNINCKNFEGLTALHRAVQSHSEPLTALLLRRGADIGDCALHAVRENQPRLVAALLDRLPSPDLEQAGCIASPDFPDHMTPMMLAAQCGRYEIIEMLGDRGHYIDHPHPPDCLCDLVCQKARLEDSLVQATKRLNQYRAIINPAYIYYTSDDPILTAFQLCEELRRWANVAPEFRVTFVDLSKEVRAFAVDLLACCRSSAEVEQILMRREGCEIPGQIMFPRLMLAMDLVQKEFVAHPNTQVVLESAWTGEWAAWRSRSLATRALDVLVRIVMLPVMVPWCLCAPKSKTVRHWRLPVNKLISCVASYIVFLVIVFLESNMDKTQMRRGPPNTGLEPFLMVFVVAHIWSSARLCMMQGPRRYFQVLSNWYDVVTQLLFVATFLSWLCALLDVNSTGQADLSREYWHYLDPTLVAEGLLAVATIMSFGRLLLLCQLNFDLGPLLVSLGKMTKDIAKFTVIFALFFLAFTAGLCRLYQYYDGMVQEDASTGTKTQQVSSFVSPLLTLKTLFWALFCMSPVESADVVIRNLPGTTLVNRHYFTETIGYISFAMFEVMSVIVLLNMLIATMSNTFQKVTDNVDIEWTFGRTEVYLSYMSQTTLPPPLNLLPTAMGLRSAGRWCRALFNPKAAGGKARCTLTHCCYVEDDDETALQEKDKEFCSLMSQLAQRYFRDKQT